MKYRRNKIMLSAMALTIITPAMVAPIQADAATYSKTFKDVSKNNVNYDIIHQMAEQNIINGYEGGLFKPAETLSRKHTAALISRAVQDLPKAKDFVMPKDLTAKNPYYNDIKRLMEADLLQVDSKGNINPNQPLTRAEMAKILVTAFELKIKAHYDFADTIEGDAETRDYVRALYSNGITTGYLEDSTFRPEQSLTRQQFAVFMHRSINVDPNFEAEPIELPNVAIDASEYDVTDLTLTPSSVYEKYSSDWTTIKTEHIISPNIGLSAVELGNYQKKVFNDYRRTHIINETLEINASSLQERYFDSYANYAELPVDELVKVFNYVQQTGKVYKGNGYVVYYEYNVNNNNRRQFVMSYANYKFR